MNRRMKVVNLNVHNAMLLRAKPIPKQYKYSSSKRIVTRLNQDVMHPN